MTAIHVAACSAADAATLSVPRTFATIQAALDAATPGDTVAVDAGVYGEKLVFTAGGSAAGGFVSLMVAAGAATRPVIDGTDVVGDHMVLIDGLDYARVEGFEIRNNLGVNDGFGIRIIGSGTHIEIVDNRIHDIRGEDAMGITVYGTEAAPIENLTIDGNEIFDCEPARSEALTLNGNVTDFAVTNNVVRDVNSIGIDLIGGETDIEPNPSLVVRNGIVRGNTVMRANSDYGGGFGAGIYCDGCRDVVIENNVVSGSDLGIEIGAENAGLVTERVVVRNNVISENERAGLVFAGPENVLVGSFDAGSSVANAFDHNLYHSAAGTGLGELSLNGTPHAGLAAWQAGTGQDVSSAAGDPLLIDPGAGDFHLAPTSPAVDIGADEAACGDGSVDAGQECDDANATNGDGCDVNCTATACGNAIATVATGEQCDDGDLCTTFDGCDGAGSCAAAETPEPLCTVPTDARASSLKLSDSDENDRLSWKWGKGPAITKAEFDDPGEADEYAVCVYIGDGVGSGVLISARVPAGAGWEDLGDKGFRFKDKGGVPDGVTGLQLRAGAERKAKIKAKARGANLGLANLGFGAGSSLTVQLHNSGGRCFGAVFSWPFKKNDGSRFVDRSD